MSSRTFWKRPYPEIFIAWQLKTVGSVGQPGKEPERARAMFFPNSLRDSQEFEAKHMLI
jgi:hypothetical protein